MTTIEFVEKRGANLFEDFTAERKEFDPKIIPEIKRGKDGVICRTGIPSFQELQYIHEEVNFNLPVLIGGKNSSGKTSLLRVIEIMCAILQTPEISKSQASDAWEKMKLMNVSYFSVLFSTTIESLSDEKNLLFMESLTKVVMNSTDKDKTLKWCDGVQIRNPNFNISELEMYNLYGEFRPPKKGKVLPEHKTTIGKPRVEKFLLNLNKSDLISLEGPSQHGDAILHIEITKVLSHLEKAEYIQQEIKFQETVFIDVERKEVRKWLTMNKQIPKITKRYQKLSTNSKFMRDEIAKISSSEWFSLIYGPAKNVIEETKNGLWNTVNDEPMFISKLQFPYTGWDTMPDWFRQQMNFTQKSDAMDFVTEGALLDVTSWLTGKPQLERGFDIVRTNKWVDTDSSKEWFEGGEREYEKGKGEREIPALHIALKNPVIARLMDLDQSKESESRIDILTRMNFFTPIQEITTQYLTSGQKQVLALIIAVQNAKQGSLILIDEPELSLHVDWQSALVEQLHAPLTGSQLVIATHSPDITMNHLHLCNVISTSNEEGDV
jgi:predicted ATPase